MRECAVGRVLAVCEERLDIVAEYDRAMSRCYLGQSLFP